MTFPYTGEVLGEVVKSVALEWNIEDKLFALAADNAFSNDMMMGNIKEWLNDRGSLVLQGDLFQMRCSNQISHLIAQKGLEVAAGSIEKIRECVKYIWSSQSRKEKFESALMQLQLAGRSVHLDVDMTWVSTYSMLKSATDLRQGFVRLAKLDSDFKCLPSSDEWEQGIMICECLKVLYDMTAKLKPERYPTTTMYFNIYEINKNIRTWESSTHKYIREMALEMRGHFDRYWSTCSLLMSDAVVLDPRYKVNLVKFVFHRLYGEHLSKTYISDFRQALNNLFHHMNLKVALQVPTILATHLQVYQVQLTLKTIKLLLNLILIIMSF
ncbi:zinc finger BED domain-containing protein RICESLEEPER 2-like [Papaver somniferum]|uniref:zinc finger BED domain-containing protein RICESLEEPER 2-like n=1 Tax=Papaver somniferum TaxID=3469 RepID=UPI000E701BAB|nr:zinc finger BED domain-containing protein RICESLEEPER 2-like [Papaver somniferum]XP_026387494.1 zinc finger BED domain-containing protein RICESLEEPER 2-like [Papaver somniferum]